MNEKELKSVSTGDKRVDVLVVGAGAAGLYSLYRLREAGYTARAFESGEGVGGTWYWNRYPGCRCDVESLEYSFGFSEELQQEWHWEDRFSTQEQILEYLNHVAERFDLRKDIQFNTRIVAAHYDSAAVLWTLTTEDGESHSAPYCIMATGNLSTPRAPDIEGLEEFRGRWYHSGLWPADGVDFSGQRVGVIGTGSSGVQMIPKIAAEAESLHVFQRTANFILPAQNCPLDADAESEHKRNYGERRRAAVNTPFGIGGYPPPTVSALSVTAEERERIYENKWQAGGTISFLYSFTDLLTDEAANATAAEFVRNKIRTIVNDPAVAERLCPKDHPIGTKRLVMDTNYFETYNQPHVHLVDIREDPIQCITPNGIRTQSTEVELDAIAVATGFDAMTGAMKSIDIRTDDGVCIGDTWQHGPRTYLGIMVPQFPNLFMVTGPQSPGVKSNMMFSIEHHVDWIARCLKYIHENGKREIRADQTAAEAWVEHSNAVAAATLYPQAKSWYMGANVPGKTRVFMPYVGGVEAYVTHCDKVAANSYTGFSLR